MGIEMKTCDACRGGGKIGVLPCPVCNETGQITDQSLLAIINRLAAIEARQAAAEMHDPECLRYLVLECFRYGERNEIAVLSATVDDVHYRRNEIPECDCWLSKPPVHSEDTNSE